MNIYQTQAKKLRSKRTGKENSKWDSNHERKEPGCMHFV
jgi:hypothetical protein